MATTNKIEYNYYPTTLEISQGTPSPENPAPNTSAESTDKPNVEPGPGGSVLNGGTLTSPNFLAGSAGWRLDANGNLEASDGNFRGDITGASGTFSGTITATAGNIGGWVIGSDSLKDAAGAVGMLSTVTGGDDIRFYAGHATPSSAPFKVTEAGQLTASSIIATGTINAQAGYLASGVYIDTATTIACESGGLNVGVAGHIRGGQTDYATGTGFFLGYSSTAYKLSIGSSTQYLRYDGTNLTMIGALEVGADGVINNGSYTVSGLPTTPTSDGFNNATDIDVEKAISLNGSSQYLSITDANQTNLDIVNADFSIEAWIYIDTLPANPGERITIVSKREVGTGGYWFNLYNNAGNQDMELVITNGANSDFLRVTHTMSTSTWYHVAVTWDNTNNDANFYVDGAQVGSEQSGSYTPADTSNPFLIGSSEGGGDYFAGDIDEVRFWNDERSSAEIAANDADELTGNEAGLVGYWKLNDTLTDESSSNNDLSDNGSPSYATSSNAKLTFNDNTWSSDNVYNKYEADNGDVKIYLSQDGGSSYTSALTKTFTGTESTQTYGDGSTELWGETWTGDDVDDTSFRLKVTCGTSATELQIYKDYGFAIGADQTVTGIEVSVEAKWDGTYTFIDEIKVKIYYGTSIYTIQAGTQVYASDGRKAGEGVGAGTGVLVFYDGTNWIACDTGATVDD